MTSSECRNGSDVVEMSANCVMAGRLCQFIRELFLCVTPIKKRGKYRMLNVDNSSYNTIIDFRKSGKTHEKSFSPVNINHQETTHDY